MNGWRVRRGPAGDIPFFVGLIFAAGAAVGWTVGHLIDTLIHHHRGTL